MNGSAARSPRSARRLGVVAAMTAGHALLAPVSTLCTDMRAAMAIRWPGLHFPPADRP
jgi:hypothetical protein